MVGTKVPIVCCAVIVADPREILQVGRGASLQLRVPLTFLPQLSSPKFELGEADDPMSSYIFGKHKEIFEYNFAGSVSTRSGFVSLITKQALNDLEPSAISWEALQASAEEKGGYLSGSKPDNPFLFVGQILEAAAVGVYTSHEGPDLDGVLITTSDDEISTP